MIRILHVDDDKDEFELIKSQLLRIDEDLQIDWIGSGEQALAILEEQQFDCVLCDYQMPKLDGLQLLHALREKGNTVPFVF